MKKPHYKSIHLSILLLFTAIASPTPAVDTLQVTSPDPILEPWRWTEFTRSTGLAGQVRDTFEDRDGNIWFATSRGVQCYDGYRWTTYTAEDGLAHDDVAGIAQTRDGAMWFGTWAGGISRFAPSADPEKGEKAWTTYTVEDGLPTNAVRWRGLEQARDGALWAGFRTVDDTTGTQGGIARFDGKAWTTVEVPVGPPRPDIVDIHSASDGSLWFTTWGHGILRLDREGRRSNEPSGVGNWTRYAAGEDPVENTGVGILESRDGSLWIACGLDGISRFDGSKWHAYTDRDGLPKGTIFASVWQTEDGVIWAGGKSGVLCRFDGARWRSYAPEELPQWSGYVIGQPTRDGSVWVGGYNNAQIFRFVPKGPRTVYDHPDGLRWGSGTDDGPVWFASRSGPVRFDGARWLRYSPRDGLVEGPTYLMQQTDDGSLWFFTGQPFAFEGLNRYHNGNWSRYTGGEIGLDDAEAILRAADGSFWVAGDRNGESAVSRFDGKTWRLYTTEDGLVGEHVSHIVQAQNGDLWFNTRPRNKPGVRWRPLGDGLLRFDGERWTSFTTEDGLSHNRIYDLFCSPDGTVWAASLIGINWYDGTAWKRYNLEDGLPARAPVGLAMYDGDLWFHYTDPQVAGVTRYDGRTWKTYTTQDGLVDDRVRAIYRAADGAFWFGTEAGVSRFDGTTWISYTEEDGLPGPSINRIWQSSDGALWFGASNGRVATFRPDGVAPETRISTALERVSSVGNIHLRWSGNDRWMNTLPQDLRYQWRMDGRDWSSWSKRTDFTFTELLSGEHAFEVRAMDRGGNVDPTPARLAFIVEAPWWRNPWVVGLAVVLLGLVGVQTGRVIRRDRILRESNVALSSANKELFGLNRDLQQKTDDLDRSNQELVVEAALERVRAKALAMQESDDLISVSTTLFDELKDLGIPAAVSSIGVFDDEEQEARVAPTLAGGSLQWFTVSVEKLLSNPVAADEFAARNRGEPYYTAQIEGDEARAFDTLWFDCMRDTNRELFEQMIGPRDSHPGGSESDAASPAQRSKITIACLFFPKGWLYLDLAHPKGEWGEPNFELVPADPLTDEELAMVRRFADVFEFAYDRFLELQEKENRNRQLEIENALERVRAQALGMQASEDLVGITSSLFRELDSMMTHPILRMTLNIIDDEVSKSWETAEGDLKVGFEALGLTPYGESPTVFYTETPVRFGFDVFPEYESGLEAFRQGGSPLHWAHADAKRLEGIGRARAEILGLPVETADRLIDSLPDRWVEHWVYFSQGSLSLGTLDLLSETDLATAKRFADVFEFAYNRFLELQEKEERNRELEAANRAMSDANRELFQANQALQRDRAVERIRGEVQAMEQASDFERVLSVLAGDLKAVGLSFDTCEIDVLDEQIDEPTMAYFEGHGFHYTTYELDPEGQVTQASYQLSGPFPKVNREMIERFIAGEPWQGRSEQTAILEVPASNYGRLRITSSERQGFTEDNIDALRDFASAIALGYARYLDIREIQDQTERKSAFLASMSHELRTPMNAIIGFARLITRRAGHLLPERHRENLTKIQQSGSHLLNLINGILDLSKIEAGRMDVNVEQFDAKRLIAACCAEVEPLVLEKPDVKLTCEMPDDIGDANTDPGRLRQILMNLLSNAIKFTDRGEVAVRASCADEHLVISVSDTGTGIPPDAVETIFEEFQQVKGSDPQYKGTGLGLPICKGFAELLNGSIRVESEVGRGSTFTIRIPTVYRES